jgi:hypothetical protein
MSPDRGGLFYGATWSASLFFVSFRQECVLRKQGRIRFRGLRGGFDSDEQLVQDHDKSRHGDLKNGSFHHSIGRLWTPRASIRKALVLARAFLSRIVLCGYQLQVDTTFALRHRQVPTTNSLQFGYHHYSSTSVSFGRKAQHDRPGS